MGWVKHRRKSRPNPLLKTTVFLNGFLIDFWTILASILDGLSVSRAPKNRVRAPDGPFWPHSGHFGTHLGHFVPISGPFWTDLGPKLGALGPIWEAFFRIRGTIFDTYLGPGRNKKEKTSTETQASK